MIDEKVFQSLRNNSEYFINLLGEPQKGENGFVFSIKDLPFLSFTIRYEIDKKFLGKIYVMVLEGKFPGRQDSSVSEGIELRYLGFIKKGKPFFASVPARKEHCERNGVLQLLNEDQRLIEECGSLEIEFLKVYFDLQEKAWRVQVRPYGGSYIKILLPPLNYQVALVKEQAHLVFSVMKRIAELIIHIPQSPADHHPLGTESV
ncbi:MAG TPA: DUF3156 family protein [Thermodesulfobacteriota bacterium]|nr:DUF3156 family protein [Thermodesulfobacteriota bacterium]